MPSRYAFSICTLVTKPDQYAQMLQSYRDAGFGGDCEYLCIDNSRGNLYDAFSGCDAFLAEAQGEYIVLTHQDIELCFDDRSVLEERLRELSVLDGHWGACGNAGGVAWDKVAIRMTDPHGTFQTADLPQRVYTLDENFMVVRRSANLCLSRDLSGYHMYGSDLCVMADVKGHCCYVIDFHLRHLSGGTLDAGFWNSVEEFARKYARAFRPRWIQSTCATVFLSGRSMLRFAARSRLGRAMGIARSHR